MGRSVRFNNIRGFTLVEVLIAMVVVLVVLLGLVQTALLSIDGNLRNLFRDEAVKLSEQRLNGILVDKDNNQYLGLRTLPFDDPVGRMNDTGGWVCSGDIPRQFRNITKDYTVCWNITDKTADMKQIEVAVGWDYKKEKSSVYPPGFDPTQKEFQHSITSILRRPSS